MECGMTSLMQREWEDTFDQMCNVKETQYDVLDYVYQKSLEPEILREYLEIPDGVQLNGFVIEELWEDIIPDRYKTKMAQHYILRHEENGYREWIHEQHS